MRSGLARQRHPQSHVCEAEQRAIQLQRDLLAGSRCMTRWIDSITASTSGSLCVCAIGFKVAEQQIAASE